MRALSLLSLAFVAACASIPELAYVPDDASSDGASNGDADSGDASIEAAMDAAPEAAVDAPDDAVAMADAVANDAAEGDAASCALGGTTGVAACDSCLRTSCCDLAKACFADAECIAIVDCARACATSAQPVACRADCRNQHPAGKKAYTDVATCVLQACKTATCA